MEVRVAAVRDPLQLGKAAGGVAQATPRGWVRALLGVPLFVKLVGANGVVVLSALAALWLAGWSDANGSGLVILCIALAVGSAANVLLVRLALRPLGALELTAEQVWRGDLEARVPASPLADASIARIGLVTNRLLDRLSDDRERLRQLASKVISAQDEERARVARELHDSAAQTLAALNLQLSAAARDSRDPDLAERLSLVRKHAGDVLEEIRAISRDMHPRVLDDLGLSAALSHLGRLMGERTDMIVDVESEAVDQNLRPAVAATLYRVAQEAVGNAIRHSKGSRVEVRLESSARGLRLVVQDDGAGFDVARAEVERPGMGLFSMQERVALVDGTLQIDAGRGRGTRITATVPVTR